MTSQPPPGSGPLWGSPGAPSPQPPPAAAAQQIPPQPPGSFAQYADLTPASRDLDPLSRRLLGLAGLLSVLLIAVAVNALLHSEGNPLNPIAAAAVRTQEAPGARYSIEAVYSLPSLGRQVVAHGSGAYNAKTGRSRMTLAMPAAVGRQRLVAVADPREVYLRSAQISSGLPPGRPWLGIEPWMGRSRSASLVDGNDAGSQLEMLRAVASHVESRGTATIRGVATRVYRGEVDLGHYTQLLREEGKAASAREYAQIAKRLPDSQQVEVWVDEAGMVRRLRQVVTLQLGAGRPAMTMDMRLDLSDFGASPRVELPPAREVFDSTPLARAELGLLDGESASRLLAPGDPPLSEPAFRRRAGAICVDTQRRLDRLARRAAPERAAVQRFGRSGGVAAHSQQEALRAFRRVSYAYFEPTLRLVGGGLRRLGRLAPPPARAAAFRRYMRGSALFMEIDEAETRALEVGQLGLTVSLSRRIHAMRGSLARATRAAGLPGICAVHDESRSRGASGSSA